MISLKAHEERVIEEQAINNAKLIALDGFISTSSIFKDLETEERELLLKQSMIMRELNEILKKRISLFMQARN